MITGPIAGALRALAERHDGRLTPELVVAAAKSKESPLHDCFTWDVKKAAHEHWLYQARALIRSVRVEVTTTHFTVQAPAYVRDPSAGESQGYATLSRLRTDMDLAREAVLAEFVRASAALARAKAVAAALGLIDAIEEVHGRVIQLTERARQGEAVASV